MAWCDWHTVVTAWCNWCIFLQAVAKYMPTGEPMLDTEVYEKVLKDFLQNNHEVTSSTSVV